MRTYATLASRGHAALLLTMCFQMMLSAAAIASDAFTYKIVAQTGQNNLVSIGENVSINDNGLVAFIGSLYDNNGAGPLIENLFVGTGTPGSLTNISPKIKSDFTQWFSPSVQLNNLDQVLVRRVRLLPTPLGTDTVTYVERWNAGLPDDNFVYDIAQPIFSFFQFFYDYPVFNDNFGLLYAANRHGDDWLVSRTADNNTIVLLGGIERPNSVLANNNTFVFRFGFPGGPYTIELFNIPAFTRVRSIAGPDNGFANVGKSPGISDDGNIVIFQGELTTVTQDTGGLRPGPGIFIARRISSNWSYLRIAGLRHNGVLDPGETFIDTNNNRVLDGHEVDEGPFSAFVPDERLSVSEVNVNANNEVTCVFAALDETGKKGIYSVKVRFVPLPINGVYRILPPSVVAKVGYYLNQPSLTPLLQSKIASLHIHDAVSNARQSSPSRIAFYATLEDGSQAVISAQGSPSQDFAWGTRVRVTFTPASNLDPIEDYLVAFDGDYIILKNRIPTDLQTGQSINPIRIDANSRIRISLVERIDVLLPDRFTFNKYVALGVQPKPRAPVGTVASETTRTVELGNIGRVQDNPQQTGTGRYGLAYSNGNWNYRITAINTGDDLRSPTAPDPLDGLYAIARVPSVLPCDDTRTRAALVRAAQNAVPNVLPGVAQAHVIPFHVLFSVKWLESRCQYQPLWARNNMGWNQFGFTTRRQNESANVLYLFRADVYDSAPECTFVTWDGGIGMSQLTSAAVLDTEPTSEPANADALERRLTHFYRVSSDAEYNIRAGAYLLGTIAWNRDVQARVKKFLPSTTYPQAWRTRVQDNLSSRSPEVIEHWVGPLSRYNVGGGYASLVWQFIINPIPIFNLIGFQSVPLEAPPFNLDLGPNGLVDQATRIADLKLTSFAIQGSPGSKQVSFKAQTANGATVNSLDEVRLLLDSTQQDLAANNLSGPDSSGNCTATFTTPGFNFPNNPFNGGWVRIRLTVNGSQVTFFFRR